MAPKSKSKAVAKPAPVVSSVPKEDNRYLPSKEAGLFAQVLQQYETKQFKQGLKTADLILKARPDHGETLAMKGLFLAGLGAEHHAEGHELVKKGVRLDMGSHIVWHVYGLLHRADKNFEEAHKCYVQANRIEKDSLNILGDLATLSIHLRNYPAFVKARQSILRGNPRLRRNWVALGVAQHLDGQYLEADRTFRSYEEMLREMPEGEYEHSEVLMYHALVLEEAGQYEQCLEFLGEHAGGIVDRQAYSVQRARLLLKLGRLEPAEWAWSLLLEGNPDSYEYIKGYVASKGADMEERAAAVKVLDGLAERFPKSLAVRRLALELVSGEEFRTKASSYLINALSKGFPSVFADVKSLYKDASKREIIGDLAEGYRKSLEQTSTFGVSLDDESASESTIESSAAYLWTLYFLAQHHSALSSHSTALALLAEASAHTPSLPEIPMFKGRVLKRAGDVQGALTAMSEARALDGQDRFLNSKNAKYFMLADQVEESERIMGLFTKKDAETPLADLLEMQGLWVLHQEGLSYTRQGRFGLALKRYHQVLTIFQEIEDDQYDFHGYSLRKSTMRAYLNMLRYMDTLRAHPRYQGVAKGAIEIYIKAHDDPQSVLPPPLTNGAAEEAAEAEKQKKKEAAKAKKAEEAAKSLAREKAKKAGKKVEEEEAPAPIVDQDPIGEKLAQTPTPLDEALKFLRPLEKAAADHIDTWLLSYEVATRRGKYLEALRALRTAHSIDASSPALHLLIVRFNLLRPTLTDLPDAVAATLDAGLSELMGSSSSVDSYIADTLQRSPSSPAHIVAAAQATLLVNAGGSSQVEEMVFQLLRPEAGSTYKHALDGLNVLKSFSSSRTDEFTTAAAAAFPLATAFKSPAEIEAARSAASKTGVEDSSKEEVVEE